MNIEVYKDTKIYVTAPAAAATGGPELLHQLVYYLKNDLETDAYMYYVPNNYSKPIHEAYVSYGNPFVEDIEDNSKNILVVPEVYGGVSILDKYKEIRKVLWWLSVDNFYKSIYLTENWKSLFVRGINKIGRILNVGILYDLSKVALKEYRYYNLLKDHNVGKVKLHLVQSEYAQQHLLEKGIKNISFLSDYLNEDFLKIDTDISKKENIVVYNPKKGYKFTKKIMKSVHDIKFIPIENMKREEVIQLLQRAKIYIDFGSHPGKDRIPREAAVLECCVITGKRGSAKYRRDINIPEKYKFEEKDENIPYIISLIKECFANYEEKLEDFCEYRAQIYKEKEKFKEDLKGIFVKVKEKRSQAYKIHFS